MQTRYGTSGFLTGEKSRLQRFLDNKSFSPAPTAVSMPFTNPGPIKSSLECWRGKGGDKLIAFN